MKWTHCFKIANGKDASEVKAHAVVSTKVGIHAAEFAWLIDAT